MKNYLIPFFFIINALNCFAQKDSLNLEGTYWEDQLYLSTTYNILKSQPNGIDSSELSYGLSLGYIKDIPLNKKGSFSIGIGIGYNYDFFDHALLFNETETSTDDVTLSSNKIKLNNLEFPIQIRWRTSDISTYSFWRVYTGLRLNYNLSNKFSYSLDDVDFIFKNIDSYNKFQTGLELSVGYGAFNLFVYYGITPIYNDATYNSEANNTSIAKFGLIFYLL